MGGSSHRRNVVFTTARSHIHHESETSPQLPYVMAQDPLRKNEIDYVLCAIDDFFQSYLVF